MGSKKEKKEHKHKKEKKKKDKDRKRHHSDDSPHASPERDNGSRHHKKRHKHSKDDAPSGKMPKHVSRDERKDETRDKHKSHHRDHRDHQHIEVEEVVEYDVVTTTEEVIKPQRSRKAPGLPDYTQQEEEIVENDDDNNGKSHESLSIDETNKLRAKLGLKPLNVPSASGGAEGADEAEKDFVHKPAENVWEKQKEEKLREKFRLQKEKRKQQAKLQNLKTLGEEDDVDDISNWVKNSRKEEERSKREIEVMSAASEFGINVKGKSGHDSRRNYSGRDLQGIEVEHDLSTFKDGRSEILVIKDKDILDDDPDDVLHSVSLDDVEKSKRNLEIKRKGFGYKAFEEEEVDEMGFFKPKSVLGKYDEEIEGETKGKFKIGASGKVDTTWEQQKEQMKRQIRARGETLELPKLKLASDYLTAAEIGFKKRKKRVRKIRKRETLKADDLEPLPGDVQSSNDHGSRVKKEEEEDVKPRRDDVIDDIDDANDELERALAKTRKMKRKEKQEQQEDDDKNSKDDIRKIAQMVRKEAEEERENAKDTKNMFSLNTTDEFCRKLGSQLLAMETKAAVTSQQDAVGDDVTIHHDDMEIDDDDEMDSEMPMVGIGGDDVTMEHNHVDIPSSSGISNEKISSQWRDVNDANGGGADDGEDHVAIEAEPIAGKGLIGALKLARRKGYIATESAPKGNTIITTNMSTLKAQNYSIEDKNAVDYLDKYAHEKYSKDRTARHERSGMTMEFNEKKDYKPKIGLIYVDELGRNQSPKEAFRKLSHRFHGKGSGKMKQEKRMKKFAEEDAMRHMNSTDTPLNTVAMMTEKQRSQSTPYIVLSGGGKTFMSGASTNADISKK